jgi:hypothetical protein
VSTRMVYQFFSIEEHFLGGYIFINNNFKRKQEIIGLCVPYQLILNTQIIYLGTQRFYPTRAQQSVVKFPPPQLEIIYCLNINALLLFFTDVYQDEVLQKSILDLAEFL